MERTLVKFDLSLVAKIIFQIVNFDYFFSQK